MNTINSTKDLYTYMRQQSTNAVGDYAIWFDCRADITAPLDFENELKNHNLGYFSNLGGLLIIENIGDAKTFLEKARQYAYPKSHGMLYKILDNDLNQKDLTKAKKIATSLKNLGKLDTCNSKDFAVMANHTNNLDNATFFKSINNAKKYCKLLNDISNQEFAYSVRL